MKNNENKNNWVPSSSNFLRCSLQGNQKCNSHTVREVSKPGAELELAEQDSF